MWLLMCTYCVGIWQARHWGGGKTALFQIASKGGPKDERNDMYLISLSDRRNIGDRMCVAPEHGPGSEAKLAISNLLIGNNRTEIHLGG
jgi:hypothetical protein